jgi:hypothetical protein
MKWNGRRGDSSTRWQKTAVLSPDYCAFRDASTICFRRIHLGRSLLSGVGREHGVRPGVAVIIVLWVYSCRLDFSNTQRQVAYLQAQNDELIPIAARSKECNTYRAIDCHIW